MFKTQPKKGRKKAAPAKKRGTRGRGSVFPDARRGGFIGKVPVGRYENGSTRYASARGATRAEVVEKMGALGPPGPTVTVRQWAERWLAGLTNRAATRAVYEHSIRKHVLPELGHVRLADLTVSQVKAAAGRWLVLSGRRAGQPLAARTVNHTLDRGATMCAAAAVDGLIGANPFALCPRREVAPKPIDPFAPAELRAVAAAWRLTTCGPLFAFLAATGCREGEGLALDISDYDPDTGSASITKSYHPKFGIGPPKSKQGVRTLTVPAGATDVREALLHARGTRTRGPLFVTRGGRRIDHSQIYTAFGALLKRLDLRRRSVHKLRHGVATALVSAGVPIGDVAKWMGDSVEMIVRTYLHPSGADVSAAVGAIFAG